MQNYLQRSPLNKFHENFLLMRFIFGFFAAVFPHLGAH